MVVLNIGTSRRIPKSTVETVMGVLDFVRKVWRYFPPWFYRTRARQRRLADGACGR